MELNGHPMKELNRAKSFQTSQEQDEGPPSPKYKTATPALLSRFRFGTFRNRPTDEESQHSANFTPIDDLIFLDSFDEPSDGTVPRIIVTPDTVRTAIIDVVRAIGSQVDVFANLDSKSTLQKYSTFERNAAFLAAAFLNRADLIDQFTSLNIDKDFYETKFGFGALHIAALCGSSAFCDALLNRGAQINPNHGVYSPLHCAAIGGHACIIPRLVKAGALLDRTMSSGETPIMSSVRMRYIECTKSLIECGANMNVMDAGGLAPIHVAADLGDADLVRVLLEDGRCDVNVTTKNDNNTAIHFAALGGAHVVAWQLLDKGANPNAVNSRQKTPLHFASRVCFECTETLLKKGANPNVSDCDQRTPLHVAVARSEVRVGAEIPKLLISWGASVDRQDRFGCTPLHIAALNELTDCAEVLIRAGADVTARTKGDAVALALVARKTPSALTAVRSVLDSYITSNDQEVSYRQVKLTFNFKYLLKNCKRGEMNFLETIVNEGQRHLLEHPLCQAFLHLKWERIRKYYIARLLFCFFFVFLLSAYVLIVLAYQCYDKSPPPPSDVALKSFIPIKFDTSLCANKSSLGVWFRNRPVIVETEWDILIIFTALETLRKLYGLTGYSRIRDYFTVSNIVEWIVILAVPATSYAFKERSTYLWQNHLGAFAVLIGWANLMVMIGQLPAFGSYVAMYTKVQKEFAKLLSAYICLLIGFTICFCAIFVKSEAFDNPFVGFVKILVMMTGEFEFENLLSDITKENELTPEAERVPALLQISAFATFVLFLLFVTIILINLLIGIAVHDIQGLKKTAGLSKLVSQTKLISHIETALFGGRVPKCIVKWLSSTSGISSLVTVNPLNARECRLPRDILQAALQLARHCRPKASADEKRLTFGLRRSETLGDGPELLEAVLRLSEEVRELKAMLMTTDKTYPLTVQ